MSENDLEYSVKVFVDVPQLAEPTSTEIARGASLLVGYLGRQAAALERVQKAVEERDRALSVHVEDLKRIALAVGYPDHVNAHTIISGAKNLVGSQKNAIRLREATWKCVEEAAVLLRILRKDIVDEPIDDEIGRDVQTTRLHAIDAIEKKLREEVKTIDVSKEATNPHVASELERHRVGQ